MTTPDGPACDRCHVLLPGGYGYIGFFFCQIICCSLKCLQEAETERLRAIRAEVYQVKKHGTRHWKVVDGNDELVCITVYKKGAQEVIRRLSLRKPPPFRPCRLASTPTARQIQPLSVYRRKRAKAA